MSDQVIAPEMADQEFNRWAEAMDLDLDTGAMGPEDIDDFNKIKSRITRAIVAGRVTVDDKGEIELKPKAGNLEIVHFYEPAAEVLVEMDRRKSGQDMAKLNSVVGAMTKTSAQQIAALKLTDYKIVQGIAQLFLA